MSAGPTPQAVSTRYGGVRHVEALRAGAKGSFRRCEMSVTPKSFADPACQFEIFNGSE
jgi:hypothetical protein